MQETITISDTELFNRIASGDEAAFSDCVHRFTPKLYPFVLSITPLELWAEDILQDVFIKIWQQRHTLTAIDNPAAYLNRTASNKALGFLKHRSVEVKAQYHRLRQLDQ